MKRKVGLWIDHKNAVIFRLADEGAEIKRIASKLETHVRFSGGAQREAEEKHDDKHETIQINMYYDEVISYIRDAESILIFGPGKAKLELQKRLEKEELHNHIVGIETVDKMTDNQIVAKVRQRFLG